MTTQTGHPHPYRRSPSLPPGDVRHQRRSPSRAQEGSTGTNDDDRSVHEIVCSPLRKGAAPATGTSSTGRLAARVAAERGVRGADERDDYAMTVWPRHGAWRKLVPDRRHRVSQPSDHGTGQAQRHACTAAGSSVTRRRCSTRADWASAGKEGWLGAAGWLEEGAIGGGRGGVSVGGHRWYA